MPKKIDDRGTFTRILETQLKPLIRKEKQLRNNELEEKKAEFIENITPALEEYMAGFQELYKGQRKVTEFRFSQENGIAYKWEENG